MRQNVRYLADEYVWPSVLMASSMPYLLRPYLRDAVPEHKSLRSLLTLLHGDAIREGRWVDPRPPTAEVADVARFFSTAKTARFVPTGLDVPDLPSDIPEADKTEQFVLRFWQMMEDLGEGSDGGGESGINKRFGRNLQNLTRLVIEAYGGKTRRTGEAVFLHPMRVMLRTHAEFPDKQNIIWQKIRRVTFLSALAHDLKEDFDDFSIQRTEGWNYAISFRKNRTHYTTQMELDYDEMRLFSLQLEALTIPRWAEALPDDRKAEVQFGQLNDYSQRIRKRHGALAAYATLLVKVADRMENVHTYWKKNGESSATFEASDPKNKIQECLRFFIDIEKEMEKLHGEVEQVYDQVYLPQAQSVIAFCYYLLLGGSYDEVFFRNAKAFYSIGDMERETNTKYFRITDGTFIIPQVTYPSQVPVIQFQNTAPATGQVQQDILRLS